LITETDAYRSAFAKGITDPQPKWNSEELRALEEFRAMAESPTSAGGYGVPVLIDPSIILTAGAAAAPVLDLCRIITITTNAWKGVSSAGVQWSYDAEGSAVSDDSPTLAQPTVTVYAARGFIPFSIEVGEDYPNFADEMATLLGHGFLDLVASNTVTGSGTSQPRGIFTALAADSTAQVITTTDGALGAIDFQNVYKALGERYRSQATWLMHTQVENAVRAFPTSSNFGYFTVDLTKDGIGVLQGRPVRTTDYAPQYTGTTLAANIAVFGDFSNFVVAQRAGMNVELVPHLFDVTYNRPTGSRGWWAYARHGYDSVNNAGFKILVNT
jgi:HK97 family phage major capsid protein